MAVTYPTKPAAVRLEIARLQWANAVMRAANKALVRGDDTALAGMGFSQEHIDDLRARGGFPSSSIGNNTRLINHLGKLGGQHAH